jgi:hypothetical protein
MTQTPTAVVGKGVYLEFIRGQATTQLLVLPEGPTTSHKMMPMTMFRRTISPSAPRKTWKMVSSPWLSSSARTTLSADHSGAELETRMTAKLIEFVDPLLLSLQTNRWTLFKDPIIVEVTSEDLELARQAKTPYKAMGRVWKVRKQLGFPKEFIQPPAEIVTPPTPASAF